MMMGLVIVGAVETDKSAVNVTDVTPVARLLLAAFQGYGIQPSPTLLTTDAALVWALIALLFIGTLMLLVLNPPLVGIWVKLLKIPRPYLYAGILLFASLGSYAVNDEPLDLLILLVLGLLGFVMRRFGWPVAPAVIGLILGPVAETNLRRALVISNGACPCWSSPGSAVVLLREELDIPAKLRHVNQVGISRWNSTRSPPRSTRPWS